MKMPTQVYIRIGIAIMIVGCLISLARNLVSISDQLNRKDVQYNAEQASYVIMFSGGVIGLFGQYLKKKEAGKPNDKSGK